MILLYYFNLILTCSINHASFSPVHIVSTRFSRTKHGRNLDMKKMMIALLIGLSLSLTGMSQTNSTVSPPSTFWVWNTTVASKYLGDILGGIFYDGPQLQLDLSYNHRDRLGVTTIGTWIARPLDNTKFNVNFGDQYNLYLSRSLDVSKDLKVTVGTCYYGLYDLEHMRDDMVDFSIRADFPSVRIAQPYIFFDHFLSFSDASPKNGSFAYVGLQRLQKLGDQTRVSLYFDYRVGYSGGCLNSRSGFEYQRLSASLIWNVAHNVTITPTIIGQIPIGTDRTFADHERLFGKISVRYTF